MFEYLLDDRMTLPPEQQDPLLMREMFGQIAPRYDFITRVFSYGMDRRWKRQAVERANLPARPVVLDLACGTGDFSKLVARRRPQAEIVAADLTHRMVRLARDGGVERVTCADAMRLPFRDSVFDGVFVGYGLRNFPRLEEAVAEIRRVLRPDGVLVSLDFFLPANRVLRRAYLGYLYLQGAFWGLLLHGRPRTYTYIPDSLRSFVSAEEFRSFLGRAGYAQVSVRKYVFGGIALHWAAREH
jgi:demethylmenaquinone methyltransferase / 2-methoxy-6-polyprenyl-1,4-benzoquinol methylase